MLSNIIYFEIFGKLWFFWLGPIALLLMIITASVPFLMRKGYKLSIILHRRLAITTLIVALIHGLLSFYVNY